MSYYNRYLESNAQAEAADRDMQEINNAIARFDGRSLCTNSATVIEESCSQEIKDAANGKVQECLQGAEQAESANPFNEYNNVSSSKCKDAQKSSSDTLKTSPIFQ